MKHANVKDEPIKDMLGNITNILAQKLLDRLYNGDSSKVPAVDYLGARPVALPENITTTLGVQRTISEKSIVYNVGKSLPDTALWLETLAGPRLDWVRALLISSVIVQGTSYIDNPLRRLFAPRANQRVVIELANGLPTSISLFGAARSYGEHDANFKVVEAKFDSSKNLISLTLFEERREVAVPLYFHFAYKPAMGFAPIHEVAENRNKPIKEFYWKLWFGDDEALPEIGLRDTFKGPDVTIDEDDVETFCAVVGNQAEPYKTARNDTPIAPMDFAIVTGWQVSIMH